MTLLLVTRLPGGDSTRNVVVLSSVNRDCGDNVQRGAKNIPDGIPCTAVRSWSSALPSAVHSRGW